MPATSTAAPGNGPRRARTCALALLVLAASSCAPAERREPPGTPKEDAGIRFEPARFSDLRGWAGDDHRAALSTFVKSCRWLLRRGAGQFGRAADWRPVCREARAAAGRAPDAKRFFERNFVPVRVTAGDGNPDGLVTGYFEPQLRGSRKRDARHNVPLYKRPPELIMVDLSRFRNDLKGRRVAGLAVKGALRPYHDRASIDRGALADRGLELVWVDSAIDAFFLQIQGSGQVRLRDGTVMRLGYDGFNGQPYTAIGRALIRNGAIPAEKMSMQATRRWLEATPEAGRKLMHTNRSYVFFRQLSGPGPVGSAGVALTPGRSIAVDRHRIPLGMPLWLETTLPGPGAEPFRRLVISQDTGGAISGAVRADVFWGAGARAAEIAGHMKSTGRYWLLRPRFSMPTG